MRRQASKAGLLEEDEVSADPPAAGLRVQAPYGETHKNHASDGEGIDTDSSDSSSDLSSDLSSELISELSSDPVSSVSSSLSSDVSSSADGVDLS